MATFSLDSPPALPRLPKRICDADGSTSRCTKTPYQASRAFPRGARYKDRHETSYAIENGERRSFELLEFVDREPLPAAGCTEEGHRFVVDDLQLGDGAFHVLQGGDETVAFVALRGGTYATTDLHSESPL